MKRISTAFAFVMLLLLSVATSLPAQKRSASERHAPSPGTIRLDPVYRFSLSADDLALLASTIGYPPAAQAAGRRADVVVKINVDTSGVCTSSIAVSGGREFDDSVMRALRGAIFETKRTPWDSLVPWAFGLRISFRPVGTGTAAPVTAWTVDADDALARARSLAGVRAQEKKWADEQQRQAKRPEKTMRIESAPAPRIRSLPVETSMRIDLRVLSNLDTLYPSGVAIPGRGARNVPPDYDLGELRARVKYPEHARQQGVEGTVYVQAHVDGSGTLIEAHVVHSDNDMLNDAAVEAVRGTRFTAAFHYDAYVDASIIIPISFRLR